MSSWTFESLPDEVLMMIFQYFGDVCSILQTFLGLNQRLNDILLDRRSHLLTDFLFINPRNDYYDSEIFQQVSEQLVTIKTTVDKDELNQILQPLLSFHVKQKYIELGEEFRISLSKFQSVRQQFSHDEHLKSDEELERQFTNLNGTPTIDMIKRIVSLVLRQGARLVCHDYELVQFNLAKAVNQQLLGHINDTKFPLLSIINLWLRLFKTLIISNTSLLKNRDYVGNGGCKLAFFLVYTIDRLQNFYQSSNPSSVNLDCYRAIVDLFLFILQCHKQTPDNDNHTQEILCDMLELMPRISSDLYIRTVQCELIKILFDQFDIQANQSWDDYTKNQFKRIIKGLVQYRRLDILKYVYSHGGFQEIINDRNNIRECVNVFTTNQIERQFFQLTLNNEILDQLFPGKYLIFILIEKKERTLLEKVLKLSPCLIDQLDEDGNDPLLHLSLKVNGCRHRIIEMLIKMGSNLGRRNFQEQNFIETLQLKRNRKLYQQLIEHEILVSDHEGPLSS